MASEKESLESAQKQLPAAQLFHPPSLVNKGARSDSFVSGQTDNSRMSAAAGNKPTGGYYQNVTQKGKLILPTAIWILMIIGGLCFLSLLSTLNKTVNTLDELIEIEQSNSRLAVDSINEHNNEHHAHNNKHHHRHHRVHSTQPETASPLMAERLTKWDDGKPIFGMEAAAESNQKLSSWLPGQLLRSSSWFAMPQWVSLDKSDSSSLSQAAKDRSSSRPSPLEGLSGGLIENMLQAAADSGVDSPIEGSIIIQASSSDNERGPMGPFGSNHLASQTIPLESMMNKLLSGGPKAAASKLDQSSGFPTISANIDKINININNDGRRRDGNGHDVDDDQQEVELTSTNKKPLNMDKVVQNNEKVESLAQSIDSLMAKLMNGPASQEQVQSTGSGALLSPMEFARRQHHSHNHGRPNLGELLQARPSADNEMLQNILNGQLPAPQGGFIIALDGGSDELPTPPRGAPFSPYELMTEAHRNPMSFHNHHHHHHGHYHHRHPDSVVPAPQSIKPFGQSEDNNNNYQIMSEEDLIKSLTQSLLPMEQENSSSKQQQPQQQQQESGKTGSGSQANELDMPPNESIVFINGQPLIADKKQSLAMDEESLLKSMLGAGGKLSTGSVAGDVGPKQNDAKDLFTMFFGPAPTSELLHPSTTTTTTQQQQQQQQQLPESQLAEFSKLGTTTMEPANQTTVSEQPEKKSTTSDESNKSDLLESIIQMAEQPKVDGNVESSTNGDNLKGLLTSISDSSEQPSLEHLNDLLGSFMGDMMTSPQFKIEQAPIQVEAQSGGQGRPGAESTSAITSVASTGNSPLPSSILSSSDGIVELKDILDLGTTKKFDEIISTSVVTSEPETTSTTTTKTTTTTTTEASIAAFGDLPTSSPAFVDATRPNSRLVEVAIDRATKSDMVVPEQTNLMPTTTMPTTITTPTTIAPMTQSASPVITNEPLSTELPTTTMATITADVAATSSSPATMTTTTLPPKVMIGFTTTTTTTNSTAQKPPAAAAIGAAAPFKTFLQKADDFIGRNFMSIRRFLS